VRTDRRAFFLDVLSCVVLTLFSIFLFKEILIGDHTLVGNDFVSCYLGLKQFLFNEVREHHSIPFWNPYLFGGIPFWAHFESTLFYPLDFLFYLLPPERAYGYTIFLHVVLTSLAMYFFARSLPFSPFASFVAATVFSFSGLMMATIYDGQMYRTQSYLWIPLILWCLHRSLASRAFALPAAMGGLFWGFQLLAGAPQDAFYTFIGGMLFLAFHVKMRIRETRWNARLVSIAGLFSITGVGIAAIQLIPSFEFIGLSVRGAIQTYEHATRGSYPLEGVITLFLPHFFGDYSRGNFWVSDVPWSVPLYNLYVGCLAVLLLLFFSSTKSHRRILFYAITLAVFALILAMGSNTPLYRFLYDLPGFDKIRAPAKILVLWVFACALLAGKTAGDLSLAKSTLPRRLWIMPFLLILLVGMDLLFFLQKSLTLSVFSPFVLDAAVPAKMIEAQMIIATQFHRFTLLSAAAIIPLWLWARGILSPGISKVLLCAVLLVDLGTANHAAVRHDDKVYAWVAQTKKGLDATIGQDKSLYRVGSYAHGMNANLEMALGYQSVGGYNPLFLHRYYEYLNHYRFYGRAVPEGWIIFFYEKHENSILMDLLNVKYEISHESGTIALRDSYLPRSFLVPGFEILGKKEILDHMVDPGFDPRQTVLFERERTPRDSFSTAFTGKDIMQLVKILSYRPDEIILETDSTQPGFLFLSEVFYPGWKAYVEGREVNILRGNYLFRAIPLTAGRHSVIFRFEPLSIKIGVSITLLTVLVLVLLFLFHRFRRTRRPYRGDSRKPPSASG